MSAAPVVIRMISESEAQRLTSRIKLVIESIDTSYEKLLDLIGEAQNSNTWQLMGFPSWAAYLASLFDGRQVALPREDRKALTTLLSEQGMSVRAIAPIVGVSKATVQRDHAGVSHGTPEPGQELQVVEPATATTASLDGKTYPRKPVAVTPRRRPITDEVRDRVDYLVKAADRLQSSTTDDRFEKNLQSLEELIGSRVAYVEGIVSMLRRSLGVGIVKAAEEQIEKHKGLNIAISAVGGLVKVDTITAEQAAAAIEHLKPVMTALQERAES